MLNTTKLYNLDAIQRKASNVIRCVSIISADTLYYQHFLRCLNRLIVKMADTKFFEDTDRSERKDLMSAIERITSTTQKAALFPKEHGFTNETSADIIKTMLDIETLVLQKKKEYIGNTLAEAKAKEKEE